MTRLFGRIVVRWNSCKAQLERGPIQVTARLAREHVGQYHVEHRVSADECG